MTVRAWVMVVAVSVCNMIFYSNMFGVWMKFKSLIQTDPSNFITTLGWTSVVPILAKSMDWAPLIILVGSLLYALLSHVMEPTSDTYRMGGY